MRHDLLRSERYPPDRKAGKAARGPRCTGGAILPCSHSPGVQPYSGGEAPQTMSRAAREPRGGGIPVELKSYSAVRFCCFWDSGQAAVHTIEATMYAVGIALYPTVLAETAVKSGFPDLV